MTAEPRTMCEVPFCRRSTKGDWAWWLCPDHWRLVSRELKALRTRLKRRFRGLGMLDEGKGWYRAATSRSDRALGGIDRRMIRQAIERSAGISG